MKTPEEYFKNIISEEIIKEWGWNSLEEFMNGDNKDQIDYTYKMIKQAQIDAYNQALEDAAKSATTRWNGEYIEIPINTVVVDKQSILKLKK